ncbi:MAG: low molecular weight protein-tyrosine-phosphatase [Bacteroidota bacterium]
MKILCVCLGNICRSPLAEGILQAKVLERGLDWEIDSAGTGAYHIGDLPDPRSIRTARQKGIDITDQRARQIQAKDLKDFDLILTMDQSNYRNVLTLNQSGTLHTKVRPIMSFLPNSPEQDVPDPYWDDNGFEQVYQMLDAATDALIKEYS